MKNPVTIFALMCLQLLAHSAYAFTWMDKKVDKIQSLEGGYDCYFFTLEGVPQADPIRAGDPWFSIPFTQAGAKETYATLLYAKATGNLIVVGTTGTSSCGYAGVKTIYIK